MNGPVAGRAQPMRHERRHAPVLAGGVEPIRRHADRRRRSRAGPASPRRRSPPGSTPTGMSATRRSGADAAAELLDRSTTGPRRGSATRSSSSAATRRRRARRRVAERLRPALPARAEALGEHREDGPALERMRPARRATPSNARAVEPAGRPDAFERGALERAGRWPDRCAGSSFRRAAPARRGRRRLRRRAPPRSQVERVAEAAGARVVRARLGVRSRVRGAQRADRDESGAGRCRPCGRAPQVGQVADPPRLRVSASRPAGRPSPTRAGRGQVAAPGAGDDAAAPAGVVERRRW